jgi:Glu-tRNA(Gln) amidotransferase subunit E-like FAD-binding protein
MTMVTIKIRLPEYLAIWLNEITKEMARTPNEFITEILHRYYDVWKIGRDSASILTKKEKLDLDNIAQRFQEIYRNYTNILIIKYFVDWLKEKGLNVNSVNEAYITEFLEHYKSSRNIRSTSLYGYKWILKRFVKFIKESYGTQV